MLVVDARDSGRALFIDMEVLDLDRRMSWVMVRGPGVLVLRDLYLPLKQCNLNSNSDRRQQQCNVCGEDVFIVAGRESTNADAAYRE